MAYPFKPFQSFRGFCTNSAWLHPGLDEQYHNHRTNDYRNDRDREVRWRLQQRHGSQCNSEWCDRGYQHDLLDEHGSHELATGNCHSGSWCDRNSRRRAQDRNRIYYHVVKCVLSVVFLTCSPVNAQTNDGTTVIANPQASSTGSVTNSAVQINQGSYSTQGLGTGHFCNSGTMVFTPFYLGAGFHPEYSRSENYGAQISFAIPLDGSAQEICKELGRKKIQQKRVDILLTRIRECTAMYEKGYMIRPNSPYSAICDDVVPIAAYSNLPASSQASSERD